MRVLPTSGSLTDFAPLATEAKGDAVCAAAMDVAPGKQGFAGDAKPRDATIKTIKVRET